MDMPAFEFSMTAKMIGAAVLVLLLIFFIKKK